MKKKHLSMEERNIIERLMQEGKSNNAIAEVLGRNRGKPGRLEAELLAIEVLNQSEVGKEITKRYRKREQKLRIAGKK